MSSVGFLIFDGLWREISARVSRFVRSASGRTAEKRRNLARSKMRGFLRLAATLSHARTQLRRAAVDAGKADEPRTSASQDRAEQGIQFARAGNWICRAGKSIHAPQTLQMHEDHFCSGI